MKHFNIIIYILVLGLFFPQLSFAQKKKSRRAKNTTSKVVAPSNNNLPSESLDNMTADDLWMKFCSALEKNEVNESVKYVKKAAEKNHPRAMYLIGLAYKGSNSSPSILISEKGDEKKYFEFPVSKLGIKKDLSKSAELMRLSAENDYCMAMVEYGGYLLSVGQADDGFKWLTKAADYEESYDDAVSLLGQCYLNGDGCEKNEQLGIQLLSALADRNSSYECYASNAIGQYYFKEEKAAKAAPWLHRAADKGDIDASTALALMYIYGMGVLSSTEDSFKYAKQSADGGNDMGKYLLAMHYVNGKGVEKDHKKAKQLLTEALKGHEEENNDFTKQVKDLLKEIEMK